MATIEPIISWQRNVAAAAAAAASYNSSQTWTNEHDTARVP